jgi:O-antigen/teichoic acid export membrane protein
LSAIRLNIGREIARGAAWMVLMRVAVRAIGLVSTIILARLLVPADFGLVALANTFIAAVEILGEFGFTYALIRDQQADRKMYDTAWTLSVITAAVVAVTVGVIAHPAALFFGDARLEAVVYAMALATFVAGFENVGTVNFRKDLEFGRDFRFMVARKLISFVVTIALALIWQNYWALVAGIVAGKFGGVALSFAMQSYRPRFSLAAWRDLFGFSKWLLVTNVVRFIHRKADIFILARLFSPYELGLYAVASEIASLPTSELVMPVQRALFPGFARLAHDKAVLARSYLESLAIMLLIAAPAAVGIAATADPLVRLFLGPNWLAAIPLLQLLTIHGVLRLGVANAGSAMIALGRVRMLTQIEIAFVTVQIPSLIVGAWWGGVAGTAAAIAATAGINLLITMALTLRALEVSVGRLLAAVWRTLASGAVMGGAVVILLRRWSDMALPDYTWLQLLAGVSLGVMIYPSVHLGLWAVCGRPEGAESNVWAAIKDTWRTRRRAAKSAGAKSARPPDAE